MTTGRPISLTGCRVLVTRPVAQAVQFCELIENAGGVAIAFPVIDIVPVSIIRHTETITDYDLAIFISANAVEAAMALLNERSMLPEKIAAIGKATASALEKHGCQIDIQAQAPFNSEALLATTAMNHVAGKKIIIFRGEGGREYLAETLRARGAIVEYREVYKRELPDADLEFFRTQLQQHKIDIITITSIQGLHNLFTLAGAEAVSLLKNIPFVVMSKRISQEAEKMAIHSEIEIAGNASDAAMLTAIKRLKEKLLQGASDE